MNNSLLAKLFSKRRIVGGLLTIAIMVVVLLVFFTYTAGAAYWNVRSQGNCASGYPRGDSWLNWDGYGSSAQGSTNGKLWYWNGSQWVQIAEGGATDTGSPGNALVHNQTTYQSGTWDETGAHWSNFFSGTRYTDANNWTCP